MKKIVIAFISFLIGFGNAHAEIVYVTDNLNLTLRSDSNNDAKVVKLIPTGTPLTVTGEKTPAGFLPVQMNNGTEGYILARHVQKETPAREQLENLTKTIKTLENENAGLKTELKKTKDVITPGSTLEKTLAKQRDDLALELATLKQSASGVVQLKNERDELQERVVNAERELQQLKLENQSLKDSSNQDWFLYGGILSFLSVLLGFILPKLGWRRKNSWGY